MRLTMATRVCALLVAAGQFGAAFAEDSPPTPSSAAVKNAYSNKLICKREQITGSMIPKKVCRTQEQIDQENEAAKQYAQEIRRNSGWKNGSGPQSNGMGPAPPSP